MSLPPFPPKDLAKLVLGYLAEEHLMTVYDEFLQESPYLDALRNEYDRIFMRSLRHILTEYRAVKIYVETCKPLALRKHLSECPNLLEVVKVLINNFNLDRIRSSEDGIRNESQKIAENSSNCKVCNTSKLSSCVCGSKRMSQDYSKSQTVSNNAVETTSLEDLRGHNSSNKQKHSRIVTNAVNPPVINLDEYNPLAYNTMTNRSTLKSPSSDPSVKSADKEYGQKAQDFDNILNFTSCNKNASDINTSCNQLPGMKCVNQGISTSGTFQEFASGIAGLGSQTNNVPDFNTTDSVNVQFANYSLQEGSNRQLFLPVKSNNQPANSQPACFPKIAQVSQNKPEVTQNKLDCNKVTILSDVRVDTIYSNETINRSNVQIPPVLNNKQTMPLLQMQTILVNGTQAYKSLRNPEYRYNYTRDEIMAMPTIILVPASGPSDVSENKAPHTVMAQSNNFISNGINLPNSVEPLTIDVSDSPDPKLNIETHGASTLSMPILHDGSAVKNKEVKKSFANPLPKDTTSLTKTNTPQVIPPIRKSSSTPRRSSHIRVLDFTTPRRILHETIKEHNVEEIMAPTIPKINTSTVPGTPNSIGMKIFDKKNDTTQKERTSNDKERTSANKLKYSHWDAALRAVAVSNECTERKSSKITKSESKTKYKNKNKTTDSKKSKDKKTATPKITGFKKGKRKSTDVDKGSQDTEEKKIDVPVKPTINIISGVEKHPNPNVIQELEKSNNDAAPASDTPEMDRLQNVGAKLNILDLLDTPYKQALYDIQMETPRFLGPDIAGEPVSDIKIMNIPTPRFLASPNSIATPKIVGSPSQYVSRGTDYSSGSSYYKPDEQDNIPNLDVICGSSNANDTDKMVSKNTPIRKDSKQIEDKNNFKSRPVRQCARNVSYLYNSPFIAKTRKDDKDEASVCSESASPSSTKDDTNDNKNSPKIQKGKRSIKKGTPKNYKKTKQAQTSVKEGNLSRDRRKFTPLDSSKLARKRNTIKEKNVAAENVITSAPTKSRRKSSTPRKLNCNKTITSDNSPSDRSDPTEKSPEIVKNITSNYDAVQSHLRWSDDGTQATRQDHRTGFEGDDIKKIQEYIETTKSAPVDEDSNTLQVDLIKRGFDVETAKTIERDLLDTPPHPGFNKSLVDETSGAKREDKPVDSGETNVVNEEEDYLDDLELSVHECYEGTINYIEMEYKETDNYSLKERVTLKEKFCMEVFIEEGVSIRLRATPFNLMFDKDYQESVEIQQAVDSIRNIEPLYTPIKESDRARCYEIFDSTLTSLDTPLKPSIQSSRSAHESTITEVVLEVEKVEERVEVREKSDSKKRKRVQSGSVSDESLSDSKKSRPEAQYLLNSANIQNIDIETVLSKLHGP